MKFEAIEKVLKNGDKITIRQAVKSDAAAIIQTVATYLMQSENLITTINEFNPTVQQQEHWIAQLAENKNSILLIATYNGKIIGNVDLKGENRRKIKHNALLGIGILKDWQGLGLGTILMETVIDWAMQNIAIENIWLNVFESHHVAIALYKRLGFEEAGMQKKYVKDENGNYINNILMQLPTKKTGKTP